MLDVTRLLRMLYVFSLSYINLLMVRYYRFYTVVAYDMCNSCREGFAAI